MGSITNTKRNARVRKNLGKFLDKFKPTSFPVLHAHVRHFSVCIALNSCSCSEICIIYRNALAGMNAHINHDLALALLQTDAETNLAPLENSPEHDDFEQVNGILEAVLPQALTFLATGIVGEAAQDTGKIGRLLAIWSVRAARDLAWDFAGILRPLEGGARSAALAAQDRITGALGRSLLLAA